MPRFFCDVPLVSQTPLLLSAVAARHVQVLRMQPGQHITLFDGRSSDEFDATITRMGRSEVEVLVGQRHSQPRELSRRVHLAVGMPANDRMDWLVEKATELGVASIQPLNTERTVLRLSAERAEKKVAHWRGVAVAASEQCGGNLLPHIHPVRSLADWLAQSDSPAAHSDPHSAQPLARCLLSLRDGAQPLRLYLQDAMAVCFLCGPEGGLTPAEEAAAVGSGFAPTTLGARVLRSETAALAALAALAL